MAWVQFPLLTGYMADQPAWAVPPTRWTGVTNAFMRDGIAERSVGDYDAAVTGTALTRYEFLAPCRSSAAGAEGLVYAGNDVAGPRSRVVRYLVGAGHLDLTPGGWAATATTAPNYYTGGPFSTGVLVNDVIHAPVWVDPNAGVATILGAALRFNALRPYKYMAIGINDRTAAAAANTVSWSASTVPGAAPVTWAAAAGNDAGNVDLTTLSNGALIDGGQLGEDFLIYSDGSTHLMSYVGGATVMTARRLAASSGILSRNCWADIGIGHVVLTQDDVVLVDASGVRRSLIDGRLRRTMFNGLYNSDGRHLNSQVWFDKQRGRVMIALPSALDIGMLTQAFVYEVASDSWGARNLYDVNTSATAGVRCATMAAVDYAAPGVPSNRLILGMVGATLAASGVRFAESDTPNTGLQVDTLLQRDDLDFGDANARKLVRGVRIRGTSAVACTLQVSVGSKASIDEAYTYTAEVAYVLGTGQQVPLLAEGRWFSLKIRASAPRKAFRVQGFDLDVVPAGAW